MTEYTQSWHSNEIDAKASTNEPSAFHDIAADIWSNGASRNTAAGGAAQADRAAYKADSSGTQAPGMDSSTKPAGSRADDDKKYDAANVYWQANQDRFLDELKQYVRIPSITEVPEHSADRHAAAEWVVSKLNSIGMDNAKVINGTGSESPLVYADWLHAPGKPTILLYTHMDVMPVEPLDKWNSPPFEPVVRDGKLWGRGTADDKGQACILMAALEGYLKTGKELPVNVKILFESEEESDGGFIQRYVHDHKDELATDAVVMLDSGMFAPGLPTINAGIRGLVTAEVTTHGANRNLHSGEFGGVAPNAMQSLAEIIAALKKPDGTVAIPDFYSQVTPPDKAELDSWAKLPFDEKTFKDDLGAPELIGDPKYSVLYRRWALPTLDINGINGSFVGGGFNTIIPNEASAYISMRMVPDMDPEKIAKLFKDYVQKVAPPSVQTDVKILETSPGMRVPTDDPFIEAAVESFKLTFNKDTAFTREGGSMEVATAFRSDLGAPLLITGFTLPDCNEHAPNENLDLENFRHGIQAMGRYFELAGELKPKPHQK